MRKLSGPIGLFDSGFGGLTVLKALRSILPYEDFVYLGDTARLPYGSKSQDTIIRYSLECYSFLKSLDIKLLVVACNTASSLALSTLSDCCDIPVIGTVSPAVEGAVEIAKQSGGKTKFGVIGTEATIGSGAYESALNIASEGCSVLSKPCPLFVPLVEQGMVSGDIVDKVVELYLKPLKEHRIDVLILGCTHYPLLRTPIAEYLGSSVAIIDCADSLARKAKEILEIERNKIIVAQTVGPMGSVRYYVTDDPSRFNRHGKLFLEGEEVEATLIKQYG